MVKFGKWLRSERTRANLTQQNLADEVECSKGYISQLERARPHSTSGGTVRPSEEMVDAFARTLGADVNKARFYAGYAAAEEASDISISQGEDPETEIDQTSEESMTGEEKRHVLSLFERKPRQARELALSSIEGLFNKFDDIPIDNPSIPGESHKESQGRPSSAMEAPPETILSQGVHLNAWTGVLSGPYGEIAPSKLKEVMGLTSSFLAESLRETPDQGHLQETLATLRGLIEINDMPPQSEAQDSQRVFKEFSKSLP